MAERALTDAEVDSELEKLEASMRLNGLLGGWAGPCRRALHDLREARQKLDVAHRHIDHMAAHISAISGAAMEFNTVEQERDAAYIAVDEARTFIERRGYRRCDIPACGCGSWHEGEAERRLSDVIEELDDARTRLRLHVVYIHNTHHKERGSVAVCVLCADDRRALGDA